MSSSNGLVKVSGSIRAGHAFELIGIDPVNQMVTSVNSWGKSWGKAGRFKFSFADLKRLLKEDGEASTIVI